MNERLRLTPGGPLAGLLHVPVHTARRRLMLALALTALTAGAAVAQRGATTGAAVRPDTGRVALEASRRRPVRAADGDVRSGARGETSGSDGRVQERPVLDRAAPDRPTRVPEVVEARPPGRPLDRRDDRRPGTGYDDRRPETNGDRYDRDPYDRDRYERDRYDDRYDRDRYDPAWPWEVRARRGWSPRYRYRQLVTLDPAWDRRYTRTRLDVETTFRQRIVSATRARAVVELSLEALDLYQNGRYVGRVDRFPSGFDRLRVTLYRDGRTDVDRDVLLVGEARTGFELLALGTGGSFYDRWRRDRPDAARLDFRRERAERVSYSRLFDPDDFRGQAPISLLPDDPAWLGDAAPYADGYGGYYGDDDGGYYGGAYRGGAAPEAGPRGATRGAERALPPRGDDAGPRGATKGAEAAGPTRRATSERTVELGGGARVRVQRQAEITRVE